MKAQSKGKPAVKKGPKSYNTVSEKLEVALRYKDASKGSKGAFPAQVGVNSSTLRRWVKSIPTFQKQVDEEGRGGAKNVRRKMDPLVKVKSGLITFHQINQRRKKSEKIPITARVISVKAIQLRDEIIEKHANEQIELSEGELESLKKFTGSESWAKKFVKDQGWKSKASKEDIDALIAELHVLASRLENLEGFNICAGKVRDAANSSAMTWRKLERDRSVRSKTGQEGEL